ncbi:cortexin domain-containing 1 isoform X1 [Cervus elaphus]|uniref:cortexin domain-containing 1 isoform X1 n=1 Tax=Cervus canadensis TaxID=1574408 RepID=UPI001C9E93F5|nr:cortexin domain-containing 1 isoform X1 [Cervus canadensis]XP_043778381.1 cortexin domain-containing 1 isoform X1 [Cervus elaphus]
MPGRLPLRSEPPLGCWPGLARAAGALTQPQPAQPGLGSAPRAPCPAPRGTGQHAPQRAHWTASPAAASLGPCFLKERSLLSLASSCDVWVTPASLLKQPHPGCVPTQWPL